MDINLQSKHSVSAVIQILLHPKQQTSSRLEAQSQKSSACPAIFSLLRTFARFVGCAVGSHNFADVLVLTVFFSALNAVSNTGPRSVICGLNMCVTQTNVQFLNFSRAHLITNNFSLCAYYLDVT